MLARLGRETSFIMVSFVASWVAFSVVLTGLVTSVSLAIVVAGVLLLPVTLGAAKWWGRINRKPLLQWAGFEVDEPSYKVGRGGFWANVWARVSDLQAWREALWALISPITATVAFCVAVTWWALALGGVSYPFWQGFLPESDDNTGLAELIGFGAGTGADVVFNLVLGVVAAVTLPFVVRALAWGHGRLAVALVAPTKTSRSQLAADLSVAQSRRDATRAAEADALRKLERDIHDGPQQRLVRLGMDLGRAQLRVESDPAGAARLIEEAAEQAREAVAELRSLSRGVAPPLLVDRGLAVALAELSTHASIPVSLDVEPDLDLALHLETAIYFVVSEALANIAKHSQASSAAIAVTSGPDHITVAVSDDGIGGAELTKGSGLVGLKQRVEAVGGTLRVSSPVGGPTQITAQILRGDQ